MSKPCDRVHITYGQIGVINYAKSLCRKIEKGTGAEDIGRALRRLRQAVKRLSAEEQREKERGVW